jgi:hypothetical protein
MAALFKKGDTARVIVNPPQGEIIGFEIDGDGNIMYLLSWSNDQGETHQRLFREDELQKV